MVLSDDEKKYAGAAQARKLTAARRLLEIVERDCGAELMEDGDRLMERLSERQKALDELVSANEELMKLRAKAGETEGEPPLNDKIANETDGLIKKIRDLYSDDIDAAQKNMRLYKNRILELETRKRELSSYIRNSSAAPAGGFEVHG